MRVVNPVFARILAAPLLVAAGAVCVPAAIGCGDKLVGLGGGVPFARVQSQPKRAGFVVLLAPAGSALHAYNESSRLGEALQRAGHSVRTIDNDAALVGLLANANADVVLTDDETADKLRDQMPKGQAAPSVLGWVALPAGSSARGPTLANCQVTASARQSGRVAREVEKIIVRRQAGAATDCGSGGSRT